MKPLARDFLTGLTAIFGLIGLGIMLIRFGELRGVSEHAYTFQLFVENAGGLKDSSPVTYNGVRVGRVKSLGLVSPPARGVVLEISINNGVNIPHAVTVSIDKSFVGEAVLDFSLSPDVPPAELTDFIREKEVITDKQVSTLLERIAGMVDSRLSGFDRSFRDLAQTYTVLGQRLNDMLEPRSDADLAPGGKGPNVRSTIARLDTALAGAQSWLTDEHLKSDARNLLSRANTLLDDANELAQSWSQASAEARTTIHQTGDSLTAAAESFNKTLVNVDHAITSVNAAATQLTTALENVNKGAGTIGQLAQNPDLYNALRDSAQRLDRALLEVQLLVEKLKKEGVKIGL